MCRLPTGRLYTRDGVKDQTNFHLLSECGCLCCGEFLCHLVVIGKKKRKPKMPLLFCDLKQTNQQYVLYTHSGQSREAITICVLFWTDPIHSRYTDTLCPSARIRSDCYFSYFSVCRLYKLSAASSSARTPSTDMFWHWGAGLRSHMGLLREALDEWISIV